MTAPASHTPGPDRIFATVNGMSTRLPDGGRQFIGGWSQDKERPHSLEYVRADLVADLLKALETAIRVADEARKEWDAAPSGMKAGKLLIALSDPSLNYRADITEMHRALASARAPSSKGERM